MPPSSDPISKQQLRHAVLLAANSKIDPTWTKSVLPTLSNAEQLLGSLSQHLGLSRRYLFRNISAQTALEHSDGNWDRIIVPLAAQSGTSLPQLTAAFDHHVQPSFQACLTRQQSWRSWCSVLTWAAGRGALPLLMPMTISTLKGMIWGMMGPRSYTRFLHTLDTVQGKQQAPIYPIEKFMVHQLLSRKHNSLTQFKIVWILWEKRQNWWNINSH